MRNSKRRHQQIVLFKKQDSRYGGDLQTRRRGRAGGRPLSVRHDMHFVMRSTQATGAWSFYRHKRKVSSIVEKFAVKYGIRLLQVLHAGIK